ncbi:hypothetical protein [Paenibacillus methanolicus]|uniref:Uncharacterized protein n=1 Tax=Paenibacillus methanolicus TaxID=582686 RepID=A0A5S5CH20_9BACL|nr:hypothetical protein [Paenibacillus methanolicus]TYP77526.1 hypothetical protein BCM02_10286 [Paenibacillus methanolicus]
MKIGQARSAAEEWVRLHASKTAGFAGAYYSGSTVGRPDGEELPSASDVDIVIVIEAEHPPMKPGKFRYREALLEATYLAAGQLASADEVLTSYHLAGSFRVDAIIADPTGRLRILQAEVARRFREHGMVRLRCQEAHDRVYNGLRAIDAEAPLHDLATSWLFPTGIMAHLPLVATLRNPTVRQRYAAAREALADCGRDALYGKLLEQLGCANWSPDQTMRHLRQLERTFDAAAAAAKTPFFFSSDITEAAKPIAIDGSIALIRAGMHREAVFWIAATFARCHKILAADAGRKLQETHLPAFRNLLADLGLRERHDFLARAEQSLRLLPEQWAEMETIMSTNPDIRK